MVSIHVSVHVSVNFILFELFPLNTVTKSCKLEKCSSYLHEISNKYQSILDDLQSSTTITLAFILFELFPLELCPSQYCVRSVTLGYLQETSCKYQSTLDDMQSTRTITLAFILFMPPTSKKLEGHIASGLSVRPSRFLMCSITLEP